MQPWRHDGYVGSINHTNNVRDLVEVMELLCVSLYNGGGGPFDEFLHEVCFHCGTKLRDCHLTRGQANPIQICNALHGITYGQS